ncbi:MAG: holo-ACP synthase [Bacilli bacterium]|nr:holo-ACP synthase [Bacilli bacterium]MBN2696770.1 holo-ACP synthase [Bacilli bacterium]
MIKGLGTDIVRIDRVKHEICDRVLSDKELEIYASFSSNTRKKEYLAGRFAAKEALTKAFQSTGMFYGFKEMVILNDPDGRPYLKSPAPEGYNVWLSISHEREYAVALSVIEDDNKPGFEAEK